MLSSWAAHNLPVRTYFYALYMHFQIYICKFIKTVYKKVYVHMFL